MRRAPVVSLYSQSPLLDSSPLRPGLPIWQRPSRHLSCTPVTVEWLSSAIIVPHTKAPTPPEPSTHLPTTASLAAHAQSCTACLAAPNSSPHKTATTPPPPPSAPARGANKRRRTEWDDDDSDTDFGRPISTPKRRRHLPYELPLGLSSTDFYSLHSPPITQSPPSPARRQAMPPVQEPVARIDPDAVLPSIEEPDEPSKTTSEDWAADEDQRLIEVVLEKFRLSQQEWDECARQVGRQNGADLGRRWHSLVGEGRVGLRRRQ
ncbi:uncharacterized protein N7473_003695 [Penicillium subrubescens]|uniref:uncharacterized protein n=1 Tax=Penicillium subrubescens TaxID=1316194 RepID=UPI0025458886|nr:uncharacterized protein N7473_003695 [Penicillium subrubescens]KAJ5906779.1 hypothetical protein N7473_003695 [Penicillium subrubescens]